MGLSARVFLLLKFDEGGSGDSLHFLSSLVVSLDVTERIVKCG